MGNSARPEPHICLLVQCPPSCTESVEFLGCFDTVNEEFYEESCCLWFMTCARKHEDAYRGRQGTVRGHGNRELYDGWIAMWTADGPVLDGVFETSSHPEGVYRHLSGSSAAAPVRSMDT